MQRWIGKGFFGINDKDDPSVIGDDELVSSNNVRITSKKAITKRGGFVKTATDSSANPILATTQVKQADGRYANLYGTKTKINDSVLGDVVTGLTGTTNGLFHKFNDNLLYANGENEIKKTKVTGLDYIYQNAKGIINIFDMNFLFLEAVDLTAYLGSAISGGIVTDGYFIYICGTNKVCKYTMNLELVTSLVFTGATAITHDTNYLYVTGDGNLINKIAKSTMTSSATVNVTTIGPGESLNKTVIYTNGTNVVFSGTTRYNLITTNLAFVSAVSPVYGNARFAGLGNSIYQDGGSSVVIYSMTDLSNSAVSFDISISGQSIYSYRNTDLIVSDGTNDYIYTTGGIRIKNINNQSNQWNKSYSTAYLINSLKVWQDIGTPSKPIQNDTGDAGNVGNGSDAISYRYTAYNNTTGLETSGGTISDAVTTINTNKNEVFFDFEYATQWTKNKVDAIGVDRWKLYRKEGTNAFKLVMTRPIYFELASALGVGTTACVVKDLKGYTYTDNEYAIIEDEIVLISAVATATNTLTIVRGAKGTTAVAHEVTKPLYMFSVIDNVATAGLTTVCPIDNDYIENCKIMTTYKNRLWIANSKANPSGIFASAFNPDTLLNDEDMMPETNFIQVNPNDGDEITGLGVFQDTLIIFKRNSAWFLTGDIDNFLLSRWDSGAGCERHQTIVRENNLLVWLSKEGFMRFNGMNVANLSESKIPALFRTINFYYTTQTATAVRNSNKNEIMWSVPVNGSTTNNKIIALNTSLSDLEHLGNNSWYTFTRSVSAWSVNELDATFTPSVVNNQYIMSGQYDGKVGREDIDGTYSDDTVAYATTFRTKNFNFGYDVLKKFVRVFFDHIESAVFTGTLVFRSGNMTSDSSGTIVTGVGSGVRRYDKISTLDGSYSPSGLYINFAFTETGASTQYQIYNIMADYKTGKVK